MAVVVDLRQRRIPVSRARLARAVDRALTAVGRPAGLIEVAVVDDAEIRRLNATHRGIVRRTDVLAFSLEAPDAGSLVASSSFPPRRRPDKRASSGCRWRSSSICSPPMARSISWATTIATRSRPI